MSNYLHVNGTQLSSIHFTFFQIYNLSHCPCHISLTRKPIIERRVTHGPPSAVWAALSVNVLHSTTCARGGNFTPVNISPSGAVVHMQPRAKSFSLAFSAFTIYKIADLHLRRSSLTLDSTLLETARGERFHFPLEDVAFEMMLMSESTSLFPFPLEVKPHISDESLKETIWRRLMGL